MATDPRTTTNPKTVNEILMDRGIRHAVYLTRLAGGEADWVSEQMSELRRAITEAIAPLLSQLEGGEVISARDSAIISEAANRATQAAEQFFEELTQETFDRLSRIATAEAEFEAKLFRRAIPIDMNFRQPSDVFLRTVIRSHPLGGKTVGEWFSNMPVDLRIRIEEEIRAGLVEGDSIDDLLRRIRGRPEAGFRDGIIGRAGRNAEMIVRSGVMNVSNRARQAFHDENREVISGYQWVLTLDDRTCPECAFGESENPYPVDRPPALPAHVGCRCVLVAVTKSWQELGIDLDEMEPGTRAAITNGMRGEVPSTLTYEQWFDMQSEERQLEILGPSRFRAYKQGVKVTNFANRGGTLTLDQLQTIENIDL